MKTYLISLLLIFSGRALGLEEPTLEWAAGGSHSVRTAVHLQLKDDKITVHLRVQDNHLFRRSGKDRRQIFLGDSRAVLDAKQGVGQEWAAFKQRLDEIKAKLDAKPAKWERPGRKDEGLWLMGLKLPREFTHIKLIKNTWAQLEGRTSWDHLDGKLILPQEKTLKIDTVLEGKRTTTLELKKSLACSRRLGGGQVCRVDGGFVHL